jgi:hypothetical protein
MQRTRRRIVAAAMDLIDGDGVATMTIPALATGLGRGLVALYSQLVHLWMTPTAPTFVLLLGNPVPAARSDAGQVGAVVSDPSTATRCRLPDRSPADTVPASLHFRIGLTG